MQQLFVCLFVFFFKLAIMDKLFFPFLYVFLFFQWLSQKLLQIHINVISRKPEMLALSCFSVVVRTAVSYFFSLKIEWYISLCASCTLLQSLPIHFPLYSVHSCIHWFQFFSFFFLVLILLENQASHLFAAFPSPYLLR